MSARILVVDDVMVNVRLLEAKLASEYFNVVTAFNGEKALEVARTERPDLVLLDVMMPGMDGFEVCQRLKADPVTAEIPVVMVTALSDVSDRVKGLEAGADDFLTKPVNDVALFARVRSLVRLKRMTEEWRLREEVSGRFENVLGGVQKLEEDATPARIVVWEQSDFAAQRISEMLAPTAQEVVRVKSPEELMQSFDKPADLVIMSLAGSFDALRLVGQLRSAEVSRFAPVLLIAAEEEMARLAKGLDLGANDYILRPIDRNELIARVRTQVRRKRLQDRLQENYQRSLALALTDSLTGLYNRRYFTAHLDGLMARIGEGAQGAAVLMVDVDFFKKVNDTYGHAAGDAVLREVALRLARNVRGFDLVARYGGEEFVVVMPETTLPIATMVAERLRAAIADKSISLGDSGPEIPVSISLGIAVTQERGDSAMGLLERADEALYEAKATGRNRAVNWEPAMRAMARVGR
ncbi:MAG TPA: PleD family two-component system response regulator [Stellaceae bacterium]|nr:PleD family two-component system response regulator [Stellaceae bacterium]